MDTKILFKEAVNLSPADRIQLIEWLVESLYQPDERIERIWAEEAERRYEALIAGKVKTIPLEEIIQRYKYGS
jgi:putative addiction module component (TIGR02574 family)